MTAHRLPEGGTQIDRGAPLRFTHDGTALAGFAGDTLASALLANGRRLVARSFKVHRPRGIVSAGPEEPCALLTVGEGARAVPNSKAPMVPLAEGTVARTQNAWPSLRFDAMAVNGLGGHALAAGFYYKTFLSGTARRWTRLFEPAIRRAAGMGAASGLPDPDRYETAHRHCDLLVVGAGPAGLMAARAAAEAGLDVVIADEREGFGGALRHDLNAVDDRPAHAWAHGAADALLAHPRVLCLPRTTVYGHYDGLMAAVERIAPPSRSRPDLPRERHWKLRPARVILATGAVERPIVHANNDRPGVMLADAARAYVNAYGVAPGRRAVIHATNDGAYRTLRDLAAAGLEVAAVVDARDAVPEAARAAAGDAGADLLAGWAVRDTAGRAQVRGVTAGPLDGTGRGQAIACDLLLVSGGWMPTLALAAHGKAASVWDEALGAFRAGDLPGDWAAAGSVTGALSTADALAQGAAAGAEAARALGRRAADLPVPDAAPDFDGARPRHVWAVPGGSPKAAFVDLQHDVTAADVALAQAEGFDKVEHLKRYTTLGMATDQGRTSNLNGLALMAQAKGAAIPDTGTTRFRPPASPVSIGALAGSNGHGPARRRTPMQDWHEAHGGAMQDAGAWSRPRAYLRAGEDVRAAYIREARAVREAAGIVDVSTLGKIDVAGPDAAAFLNRIYANGFAKLPVGRARYGVMLREDGVVFDDGTAWRLAEDRFLVTTTTANAARVMAHMERHLALDWPEMRVHLTSVTDAWAAVAVAGPNARAVLRAAIDGIDWSREAFPQLAIRHGRLGDVPVMACRLSFSGEAAWEVFAPAPHGPTVWEALLEVGAPHGLTPYGTEALGTLRIEKGHVAGPELDGRTTMHDIGLGRMASTKKPYIGAVMMRRAALTDAARPRLVGLRAVDGTPIPAGAHLVGPGGRSEGHVTSVTHSPATRAEVALALLERGPDRMGERLTAADPLRGRAVAVEVVAPCFVDPDGARQDA